MAIKIVSAEEDDDLVLHLNVLDALGGAHRLVVDGGTLRCADHADMLDVAMALGAASVGCAKWGEDWAATVRSGNRAASKFGGKGWDKVRAVALARISYAKVKDASEDADPLAAALGNSDLDLVLATTSAMSPHAQAAESLLRRFDMRCGAPTQDGGKCRRVLLSSSRCPCHGARVAQ